MLELTRKMTMGQITAREDFAKRIAAEKPVYLHECLYPLMQGWDSVEIRRRRAGGNRAALQPAGRAETSSRGRDNSRRWH